MIIHYKGNRFLAWATYEERHMLKEAGFRWDADVKQWYTDSPHRAASLQDYCDDRAKEVIRRNVLLVSPWAGGLVCPKGLTLRHYQEDAIRWALTRNRSYLALDPGLGKTICAAVLAGTLGTRLTYVCPPFLVSTVQEEFSKWAPGIEVQIIPDTLVHKQHRLIGNDLLVVDEAHRFKNATARRSKGVYDLFAVFERVVFMSGTPMPNCPMELFAVLSTAAPESIGFRNRFEYGVRYCGGYKDGFGWNFQGATNMRELVANITEKFMLRIKKSDVLTELPPKTESMILVENSGMSAELASMDAKLLASHSPEDLMEAQIREPHVASYRKALGLAKVDAAVTFIKSILEDSDESVLVFAFHKDVVKGLTQGLTAYCPFVITGDTPMGDRAEFVRIFQTEKSRRVFIGNIQAMGVGFTLTKATRVVFVEYSWTPAENEQAADRAHRIGQNDAVFVQYIVYRNSLDRAVLETIFRKRKVIQQLDTAKEHT